MCFFFNAVVAASSCRSSSGSGASASCRGRASSRGCSSWWELLLSFVSEIKKSEERKAKPLTSASCFFPPVQRLISVHQPGHDPVQPVQGPRPAAPLRHDCKAPQACCFFKKKIFFSPNKSVLKINVIPRSEKVKKNGGSHIPSP